MAGNIYAKNIKRTIFGSLGRYIAILAIIALGVGFFVGVKNTKSCMMETCDLYVNEHDLYDFRVISTYGFTDEDVKAMAKVDEVKAAEGGIYTDFFSENRDGESMILRAHSVTSDVNRLNVVAGRMPSNPDECIVDDFIYTESDIGKKVKIADKNNKDTKDAFEYKEYEIVGIAKSSYYMMKRERGTTSLGDGSIAGFVYIPREGMTSEYYTEIFVTCKQQGYIFSDEYNDNMDKAETPIKTAAEDRARIRYDEIVDEATEEIDEGKAKLEDAKRTLESERDSAYAELRSAKRALDQKTKELADGRAALKAQKAKLPEDRKTYTSQLEQVNAGLVLDPTNSELLQAKAQLEYAIAQIDAALEMISAKEKELAAGQKQIDEGYDDYYDGLADADRGFAEAEAEIADAEKELKDAEEELEDLEAAEIFLQKREDNAGFGSFESNADIVDSIAKVFPVFFFLIAALVCSTTMSRMIEEERTQIGALRAIGYTSGRIMLKYMIYSGSAAIIGCVLGFMLGSRYFPLAIWIAYGMMFDFAPLEYYFSLPLAIISLVVSLVCSTGTTYFACRGQLANMPAEILRPKAPKAGKRVLLEKVGFIWNRMMFLHKVTVRNILRYKKRMIMMIIGIGGCASLVLAGFGMDDSVAGISDDQYSNIEKYDVLVAYSEEMTYERQEEFDEKYGSDLSNTAVFQQSTVTLKNNNESRHSTLIVTDDKNIENAISFKEQVDDENVIPYPGDGEAVINNKMAEMLEVEVGDTIKVEYDDTKHTELTVSGIYRNYVSSYIFINDKTYEDTSGESYEPSMMYLSIKEGRDVHLLADKISDKEDIIAISVNEDVRAGIDEMMESLNYIIILVILCAGALAFIVLFNLSNINLTERVREIATIEVLGFYPRETGAYVFRENLILVIFGIIAGLPTGFLLHRFIMNEINIDMVSFNNVIEPVSYVYTVIVVLLFTFIVDIIMRRKLKKINMAEALKSIE